MFRKCFFHVSMKLLNYYSDITEFLSQFWNVSETIAEKVSKLQKTNSGRNLSKTFRACLGT